MMETAHLSDSRGYDLAWASNIVKRAWQHVQNAFEAEGKAESLEVLRPFVDGSGRTPPNQEEAAEKLGVPDRDAAYLALAFASALSRSAKDGSGEHSF